MSARQKRRKRKRWLRKQRMRVEKVEEKRVGICNAAGEMMRSVCTKKEYIFLYINYSGSLHDIERAPRWVRIFWTLCARHASLLCVRALRKCRRKRCRELFLRESWRYRASSPSTPPIFVRRDIDLLQNTFPPLRNVRLATCHYRSLRVCISASSIFIPTPMMLLRHRIKHPVATNSSIIWQTYL